MDGPQPIANVNPFAAIKECEQLPLPLPFDYLKHWWEIIHDLATPRRSQIMTVLCRLKKVGVPPDALTEIALDYAKRYETIRQPWAYYSRFGAASTAAKVRAALAEWSRIKERR